MLKNKSAEHYYWLDLFRGLASLIVVTTHCRTMLFVEYGLLPPEDKTTQNLIFFSVTRVAHEAVLLFFVLSGFLVGGKVIQRLRAGTFDLKSYTLDRTVRIMLPLLSAFIIILISNTVTGQQFSVIDYLGNLLSLQGILVPWVSGPLWSLAYEVWFYVLMGAVAWLLTTSKETNKYAAFAIVFVNLVIFSYYLKPELLFVWVLGAVSCFYAKKNNVLLFASVCLFTVSMVAFQLWGKASRTLEKSDLNIEIVAELCLALSMCVIVQQVIYRVPKNKLTILINKMGTKLADFSYTLYLTHLPIVYLLIHFGFPKSKTIDAVSISYYIAAIVIVIICAYLIYLVFEKRTKYVKDVLRSKMSSRKRIPVQEPQATY